MKKIISLGEILLRLSPPNYQTLMQTNSLECQFGGSELNVLANLSQLGKKVSLISAVPNNELGKMAENFLLKNKVGKEFIIKKGNRLGLYYYQRGFSLRSSRVVYDRNYSAFYESTFNDYDLEVILDNAMWLHISGITAALNQELYDLSYQLMFLANKRGIPVSLDLNYRENLWTSFEEARKSLSRLVAFADVCIGIEPLALPSHKGTDLKDNLGIIRPYKKNEKLVYALKELAAYYNLKVIAFTNREMISANECQIKSYIYDAEESFLHESKSEVIQILDRVGTGDAYTAGVIYGLLENKSMQETLNIAMANFKYKHTIEGDVNVICKEDIEQMLIGNSYDIKR